MTHATPLLPLRDNRWYGRRADLPDIRDYRFAAMHPMISGPLPTRVDLRAHMPPVWDQGALGSCVGHGVGAAFAFAQRALRGRTYKPARLFIYYGARQIEGSTSSDAGCEIRDGIKTVATLGAPHETFWPYHIDAFAKKPPATAYADGAKHLAITYARVNNSGSSTEVLQALAAGFPVVIGITVFASFEGKDVSATGVVPMPAHHEQVLGGHCMAVVGYETVDGALRFITRNSWGKSWGDAGYCYLPAAYLTNPELASDFWVINAVES